MYPQGKYTSGIDATSCSDCPSCDSGRWSNCTVIDAGSCVLCSQDTAPVVFLGPGLVRNASTAWSRSHNCTKVTLFQWGSWIQTMQKQCYDSLHLPNSCPWQCSDGYFKAFDAETRQEVCRPCSTSMCDVGEYRSNCTAAADGLCVPCTNTTLPANTGSMSTCSTNLPCLVMRDAFIEPADSFAAVFASAGQPYNRDACAIRCADGMYPTKDLASPAASNSETSVCQPCNNTKPSNAIYSAPSHLVGVPFCPWACDEGERSCCAGAVSSPCICSPLRPVCRLALMLFSSDIAAMCT